MSDTPKVALLIETSRGYGRGMLRGIVRYARLHGPWGFYLTPGDFKQALLKMQQWGGTGIIARIETPQIAQAILDTGLSTTAVGLPDDSNADSILHKHRFCWMTGQSGRSRAMIAGRPTLAEAFIANPHGPSPSPPRPPAVLSVPGVIAAPSQAGAAAESARESPGTDAWGWQLPPSGR